MIITIILLQNRIDVSVEQSIFCIIERICDDTETELIFMIQINLISLIESMELLFNCLFEFLICFLRILARIILNTNVTLWTDAMY
jgi:hypothetical protein